MGRASRATLLLRWLMWPALPALLVACLPFSASALDPRKAITQYVQEQWPADELPSSSVAAFAQTPDGYLWFGTQNGLVRFDGVAYRVFNRRNTPVLGHEDVRSLLVDREATLWIGTSDGLHRMRDGDVVALTDVDHPHPNIIDSLFEDRDGTIWAGTSRGLHRVAGGDASTYALLDGAPVEAVHGMAQAADGALWFGSFRSGVQVLRDGRLTAIPIGVRDAGEQVTTLRIDQRGDVWIGTLASGLMRIRAGAVVDDALAAAIPKQRISELLFDDANALWIATEGAGVHRIHDGALTSYREQQGLPRDVVVGMFLDGDGSLWLGFDSGGLTRLRDGVITPYTPLEGFAHDQASAIYQDPSGAIWAASLGGGVSRFDGGAFRTFTTKDGLPSDHVGALGGDRAGGVWIGTRAGLSHVVGDAWTSYGHADGAPRFAVWALHEDRKGTLWIGTSGGLFHRRDGTFTNYGADRKLAGISVRALLEDDDGNLWAGAFGDALTSIRDDEPTRYIAKDGLVSRFIVSLQKDAEGALWIGTFGAGIIRYKHGRFAAIGTQQGLFDDSVFQSLEDGAGNVWMCSNKGIFRVAKRELDAVADGALDSVSSTAYAKADGMKSAECNGGLHNAGFRMRDGTLWFPTIKGLAVVDPAHAARPRAAPHVLVETFAVNHGPEQTVRSGTPLTLAPGVSDLEIHYTATRVLVPQRNRFRYRLDGFDRDWVEAGARRAAYYTNLPPGAYRFRVEASGEHAAFGGPGAALDLELEPRFTQTLAFKATLAALALVALWLAHRLRIKLVEARNAVLLERQRIAREIHDDLAQQLSGAVMLLGTARKALASAPERAAPLVEQTSAVLEHAVEETRRSIWSLRPQPLEHADLATALRSAIAQRPDAGVPVALDVSGTPRKLPEAVETHLLRFAQEALSNAVHHGRPTRIDVTLDYAPTELLLRVADDGRGMDPDAGAANGRGYGVPGMRERARQVGGTFDLESAPGRGTQVELRVPRPGRLWRRLAAVSR